MAAETFYYLVKKADWPTYATRSSYCPPSFSSDGFIALLTPEHVLRIAQLSVSDGVDWLLLQLNISAADPLLKWETVPGHEASVPHYYGALPRPLIQKVHSFQPQQDKPFTLPNSGPFVKRMMARLLPSGIVTKFLSYQDWQKTDRFHPLQVANFRLPNVRLQWWYFDFFLDDGSSMVLAFIPQHWWEEPKSTADKKAVLTLALKPKSGAVKRFLAVVPQSELTTSADHLEIPDRFVFRSSGIGTDRTYSIQVNFPEVKASIAIHPTRPPFAAFPTGVMPSLLQVALRGVPLGSPPFSYVSQIPNGIVSGWINWEEYGAAISGQAYHEQGRLDDSPARQSSSWIWYHFVGDGWTIFGTPGSYVYLQYGDRVLRSGSHLIGREYTLQNRVFSSPDHPKMLTGGEILFRHENLSFRLKLDSATTDTLVCFPSSDPSQIWGTVEGAATLWMSEGETTTRHEGRMFLETCSWQASTEPEKH